MCDSATSEWWYIAVIYWISFRRRLFTVQVGKPSMKSPFKESSLVLTFNSKIPIRGPYLSIAINFIMDILGTLKKRPNAGTWEGRDFLELVVSIKSPSHREADLRGATNPARVWSAHLDKKSRKLNLGTEGSFFPKDNGGGLGLTFFSHRKERSSQVNELHVFFPADTGVFGLEEDGVVTCCDYLTAWVRIVMSIHAKDGHFPTCFFWSKWATRWGWFAPTQRLDPPIVSGEWTCFSQACFWVLKIARGRDS